MLPLGRRRRQIARMPRVRTTKRISEPLRRRIILMRLGRLGQWQVHHHTCRQIARATRVNFYTVCTICRRYKLRQGDYRVDPFENVGGHVSATLRHQKLRNLPKALARSPRSLLLRTLTRTRIKRPQIRRSLKETSRMSNPNHWPRVATRAILPASKEVRNRSESPTNRRRQVRMRPWSKSSNPKSTSTVLRPLSSLPSSKARHRKTKRPPKLQNCHQRSRTSYHLGRPQNRTGLWHA